MFYQSFLRYMRDNLTALPEIDMCPTLLNLQYSAAQYN